VAVIDRSQCRCSLHSPHFIIFSTLPLFIVFSLASGRQALNITSVVLTGSMTVQLEHSTKAVVYKPGGWLHINALVFVYAFGLVFVNAFGLVFVNAFGLVFVNAFLLIFVNSFGLVFVNGFELGSYFYSSIRWYCYLLFAGNILVAFS
jgi:hypothetical protein